MRIIDADALKLSIPETRDDVFENCRNCTLLSKEQVLELIDAAPTIEVNRPTRSQFKRMAAQLGYEPVVHCEDCRLGEPDMIFNGYKDDFWCTTNTKSPPTGFARKEKGEPMRMNQMEHELWKMAAWIVCPWCDERKCVGRENCVQLAEWIVKKKEEIRDEQ